jgi:hypothetical protein
VSSNHVHDEVYSIQHYVDKVCQWLAAGQWFSPGSPVSSTNKTDRHDITEILFKMALSTVNLPICNIEKSNLSEEPGFNPPSYMNYYLF